MNESQMEVCSKKQALCSKEQLTKIEKTLDTTFVWLDFAKKVITLINQTLEKLD